MRCSRAVSIAFVIAFSFAAAAQPATCPALVSEALIAVGDACGGIGRNEACYGNLSLMATPRDENATLQFDEIGDRVDVAAISALQLSSLSEETNEWGIALMALQANLPDNLPGQNATIVLFGDVQIENRGAESAPVPPARISASRATNINDAPDTAATRVGVVGLSESAVGRTEDGVWLRVLTDEGVAGWAETAAVDVDSGEIALLPVLTADDPLPPQYGPMQAFRLKTGIGAASCSEAPASGILIQTPEGVGEVSFEVNKVAVTLGSTAVARTTADTMRIALLDGHAVVAIGGQRSVISTGSVGIFELDANGDATGVFTIEPYAASDVASLPLMLVPDAVSLTSEGAAHPIAPVGWEIDVQFPEMCPRLAADSSGEGDLGGTSFGSGGLVIWLDLLAFRFYDFVFVSLDGTVFRWEETIEMDYGGYVEETMSIELVLDGRVPVTGRAFVTWVGPNDELCERETTEVTLTPNLNYTR